MNNKINKIFFLGFILIVFLSFYSAFVHAVEGDLTLKIVGFGLRHGTPDNVNLGTLSTSTVDQEFTGQFSDYFWIEDMQGDITGHYTTIQCNGAYGPTGTKLTGVYLKAGNTTPERILGLTGDHIFINPALTSYTSILDPITYIYKETHNDNAGLANKYGDKPRLKIVIPAYTPPGLYSGTIIFSFYPN